MNTPDADREVLQPSAYNPFPEPQTIPSGWDISGFFSTPQPDFVEQAVDSVESESNDN